MSRPHEWFNTAMLSATERRLLLTDPIRYAQSLAELGDGRRLVKVHYDDLENVVASRSQLADPPASETIGLAVRLLTAMVPTPRIVFLSREDKLRQGISLWRARMTGVWEAFRRDEGHEPGATPPPPAELRATHVEEILTTCENLAAQEVGWTTVLRRVEIPYLQVTYEQLVRAWDSSIERIWSWLCLGCSAPEPITAKLSDEWSDAVASRLKDSWAARQGDVTSRIEPLSGGGDR